MPSAEKNFSLGNFCVSSKKLPKAALASHFLSPALPDFNRLARIDEHDDIQGEIIADPKADKYFHCDYEKDCRPDGQTARKEKSEHHEKDVENGIQNRVAVVIERNGDFSVAVYDKIRVFKYLPRSFHKKRQEKSEPPGPSSSDEP